MSMTRHTHSAMHAVSYATANDTAQEARTGADIDLGVTSSIGTVYPYAFVVQTAGLIVLENEDADALGINAVAGVVYPLQGVNFKAITTLDDANTDADEITFFYTS